jgi:regulation of enolase protein 1 (concanavalin A-like superfamily)
MAHDLWKTENTNKAPRLLQATTNTDFKFEVKFETAPKVKHQLQGIIVQQNDNVFLRFDVFYNTSSVQLFIAFVDGASGNVTTHKSISLPTSPNYRQVIRTGDNWMFRYSSDGSTWIDVTFSQQMNVKEVGVFAGTVGVNPKFLSSVDYFIDLDQPINDDDTWTPPPSSNVPPPVINTWYRYDQPTSGQLGLSQKWTNVLGNVSTDASLARMVYTINGGSEQSLRFGADRRRLSETRDFTIEIDNTDLNVGFNQIEIKAQDSDGQVSTKLVTINYAPESHWPFPYTANWGAITKIQDVENIAHIVDGLWKLTPNGIRTVQTGYDRTIAIGDMTWVSDYEVTVPITLHSEFSAIGFAVGWQGHEGVRSPKIEWPLQALAWIRGPITKPKLEIITYGGLPSNGGDWEHVVKPDPRNGEPSHFISMSKEITYMLKSLSSPLGNGKSRFSVKFWPKNEDEPATWDLEADIPSRDGSVLLVAHKADATFGNVFVKAAPLSTLPPENAARPVISNVKVATTKTTATVTWNTDKPANSVLDYGSNSQYGLNKNDATQTTNHSLSLTGLNSSTAYHYQAKSADSNNKTALSGDKVFTTKDASDVSPPSPPGGGGDNDGTPPPTDTTPPIISDIQVSVANTSATITWVTNEASDSVINYGQNTSYGLNVNKSTQSKEHSLTLRSLNPITEYHFQIKSADSSNNIVSSDDMKFTTKKEADKTSPVISNIRVTITGSLATVTWNTDEPSTSEINVGLDSNYGGNVVDDSLVKKHKVNLTLSESTSDINYFYQIKSIDSSNNIASNTGVYKLKANKGKECLFNWAEKQYSTLFSPASVQSQLFENYKYRYYSKTNVYLGFFKDKNVHLLEANKTDEIVDVGDIESFLKLAGC